MSISCCVAEIVQKCSEIKTRGNLSKYKRRNVSDAFFNYPPLTLFRRCGLKLVFVPHSVKSFDFSLWDSMSFACPLIERQLWLLTINYSILIQGTFLYSCSSLPHVLPLSALFAAVSATKIVKRNLHMT